MGKEFLKRYTDLPSLIHMLRSQSLTLLDPVTWDDKNDAYYMRVYKEKKKLESLLALCFTQAPETYHHWKVFAAGSGGVCVQFDKALLLKEIGQPKGVRHESITYKKMDDLKDLSLANLPFVKRYAFRDEQEYRIIYENKNLAKKFRELPIELSCISRITLSPWLPKPLVAEVKQTLKSYEDTSEIEIYRTTLNENSRWQKAGKNCS